MTTVYNHKFKFGILHKKRIWRPFSFHLVKIMKKEMVKTRVRRSSLIRRPTLSAENIILNRDNQKPPVSWLRTQYSIDSRRKIHRFVLTFKFDIFSFLQRLLNIASFPIFLAMWQLTPSAPTSPLLKDIISST